MHTRRSQTRSQNRSQTRSRSRNRTRSQTRSSINKVPPVPQGPPILTRYSALSANENRRNSRLKREYALPPAIVDSAETVSDILTTELLDYEYYERGTPPDSLKIIKHTLSNSELPPLPETSELVRTVSSSSQDGEPIMKTSLFRQLSNGILTPEIQQLIRQSSNGVTLRFPKGTTSCRHLQLLYLVFPLMKLFPEPHDRQLLSKIWNTAIKVSPKLDQFYTWNKANTMPYEELETIPTTDGVYPMGLVKNEGEHVCHYFLLLIERGKPYIYSAYGSDYVRMYPKKTELIEDEFATFIQAVNTYTKDKPDKYENDCRDEKNQAIINGFITTYFLSSGDKKPLTYIDEGESEDKPITITEEQGIAMELKTYLIPFKVIYFDKVQDELKSAVEGISQGRFAGGNRTKRKTRTKRIRLKLKK
jgi:hypothetical protein